MGWIKNALLDIAVPVVMLLATVGEMEWAWWIIAIYTPFMLVLKAAAYFGRHSTSKFKPTDAGVPTVVYHVLYAANLLIAAYDRWWWVAGAWAVIWVLSAAAGRGTKAKK
jgi:hypothetical protein